MNPVMIPGFSPEQSASLQAMITAAVNEAFDKHFGLQPQLLPVQHSTPPAPQEAQKEEDKQPLQQANAEIIAEKQAPLYQATVEDDTEINAEKQTELDSKSTLSSMPRLCATRSSGDSAACLSMAYSACAAFLAWHGLLPGYIECTEGMEATGQG